MLQGFARFGVVIAFIVVFAAGCVSAMGLLIDATQKLTMADSTTDNTFYADLFGNCDYLSDNCG
jgi:hypothetical protein